MATLPSQVSKYRIAPRAQFAGQLAFLCPACERLAAYTLRPSEFRIECRNRACRHRWIIGLRVLDPSPLQCSGPKALTVPDDIVFPVAALEEFTRSTRNIHELKTFAPVSYRAKKKRSVEPKDYSASNLKRSQSLRRYYQQKQALTNQQAISTESATDPQEV